MHTYSKAKTEAQELNVEEKFEHPGKHALNI
jgi:hypothetical protein